jgi:hypothetical protein
MKLVVIMSCVFWNRSNNTHFFKLTLQRNYRNTDKMSDAEKMPLALAGVAVITLPFIAGMIALYASK